MFSSYANALNTRFNEEKYTLNAWVGAIRWDNFVKLFALESDSESAVNLLKNSLDSSAKENLQSTSASAYFILPRKSFSVICDFPKFA